MKKTFLIKVELDDWTAEELLNSLKNQMPFSTENCETIQVEESNMTIVSDDINGISGFYRPSSRKDGSVK